MVDIDFWARDASARAKAARQAVANLTVTEDIAPRQEKSVSASFYHDPKILEALQKIDAKFSNSYLQIVADFEDENRLSWSGTAHEIRELLRGVLDHLAPSDEVCAQAWFKQETGTSGPTQKQKVRYVLAAQGGGSKQEKVASGVDILDEMVGALVRDVYARASDAAHRSKNKAEAFKILQYFQAFAYDLLDIH